ncbi:3-hydroxybutyryl-CoA dehydrogenase [wastewater metagenome]|uniref:3-hydroxybutyryl-CoA dehydrogenase n=4 Tax=root TaxID=1 RepID=A0A5B8RIB4_9ZZZZ|nr:3-hydroxyacyl-CoA dehydrogenase NAD-binding domain-containing protein [Arhodomonas sp. KWT]QEA06507.1 3-hydroxybutyryl-CoA dehydrogenase [uncultured organism]
MTDTPQRIAVVGAGTMGRGIAQTALVADREVVICDVSETALEQAREAIGGGLRRLVDKGRLEADAAEAALARLSVTTRMADLADATVIVEAAPESPELKEGIFRELDTVAPEAILASNTSSLSLTRLAEVTGRPERVVGMHFFNPVPVMPLVEVIRARQTADHVVETVEALARDLGKTPVRIGDSPGFAVNRILIPMINEAAFVVEEGVATAEAVDEAMRLGANHPIGPLALADMIGVDVVVAIMEVLQQGLDEAKYRPCPLLRRLMDEGHLGRKTGRGFCEYPAEGG